VQIPLKTSWFTIDFVFQLPEDGAITPKHLEALINYTTAYVVCAFVGLITKYKLNYRSPNKQFQDTKSFLCLPANHIRFFGVT
jgi:hypothetical protein